MSDDSGVLACARESIPCLWLGAGLALAAPGGAGPGGEALPLTEEYLIGQWQTEDGLPQNTVNAITQTRDGFLWVGTFNGLARFDGVRFTSFTVANTPELKVDDILSLFEDDERTLWIGTRAGGLCSYRQGRIQACAEPAVLGQASVHSMVQDSQGTLWVGAFDGVFRRQGGRFEAVGLPANAAPGFCLSLACSPSGQVWLGATTGLYAWDQGQFRRRGAARMEVEKILFETDDRLVFTRRGGGLFRFEAGELSVVAPAPAGSFNNCYCLDSAQGLWLGHSSAGLVLFRRNHPVGLRFHSPLPDKSVASLHADREGGIWVGTDGAGLLRLRRKQLTTWGTEQGLPGDNLVSVALDGQGRLWAGCYREGLAVLEGGAFRPVERPPALRQFPVVSVSHSRRHGLLVSQSIPGVMSWPAEGGAPRPVSRAHAARAMLEDHEDRLWLGFEDGILGELRADQTNYFRVTPTADRAITSLRRDQAGDLWVGTYRGLYQLSVQRPHLGPKPGNGGASNRSPPISAAGGPGGPSAEPEIPPCPYPARRHSLADGLRADVIQCLYVDRRGELWVGTAGGGLAHWMNGAFASFTAREGLMNDVVAQILEDDAGHLWIGSNAGLGRFRIVELESVMSGQRRYAHGTVFTKNEGLRSAEFGGSFQPACVQTADGRLWFCTVGGLVTVDPRAFGEVKPPPPVYIESVEVDGVTVAVFHGEPTSADARLPGSSRGELAAAAKAKPLSVVRVPPGFHRLIIQFAGLDFDAPEKVRYRIRLDSHDPDWVELGARRTAYYTHLPAGRHIFRVMAANNEGTWNETPATLGFEVGHFWWQSSWFRLLEVAALAGLLFTIYAVRVGRLRRARETQIALARRLIETQESDRKRVAAELHDGIGQSLLVVKNWAALGLAPPQDPARMRERLGEISAEASKAIREVREIAHNLRPFQLDTLGVTAAIRSVVSKIRGSTTLQVEAELGAVDGLLGPELETHLVRLVQESLSNVVRHARAGRVEVALSRAPKELRLVVRDNGCGFDPQRVAAFGSGRPGFGLAGLTERVRIMNGSLQIDSGLGKGTVLTFRIPLPAQRSAGSSA